MSREMREYILLVEDEPHIAEGIRLNLSLKNYNVKIAPDGVKALEFWAESDPKLIILDLMLPKIDGLSVLKAIRQKDERVPILVLSAKSMVSDRVKALSLGADDYLTKPFHLDELLLRVDGLIKKAQWYEKRSLPSEVLFGPNRVDLKTYEAWHGERKIQLTEQEVRLLEVFLRYPGILLDRQEILEIAWGKNSGNITRTVDNFMVRFRKYFEVDPKHPQFFKSIRSKGYLFQAGPSFMEQLDSP